MKRRTGPLFSGNLDALMDTLTNIVGILIIILILVQVGVGQSLKKIVSELPEVSVEELERIKEDATDQIAQYERLKETIDKQKLRANEDRDELARLNPQLTTLETSAERSPVGMLDLETIRGKNLDNARELDALRRQIAELLAEQTELKAALDTTPVVAPPPDKIVRIPNSRPLAETAKIERFLVVGGRIYGYDPVGAKKLLLQEFNSARTRLEKVKWNNPDGTVTPIYEQEKVVQFFEQRRLTLHGMEIRVPYNKTGTRLNMELRPRPDGGESIETASQFNSRFQDDLRRLKTANTIVWFNVTLGSFDTYLRAREICEVIGAPAGWELVNAAGYAEALTEFEVNRIVEPTPRPTPIGRVTPRPVPNAIPRAATPAPIPIEPPKKKLD